MAIIAITITITITITIYRAPLLCLKRYFLTEGGQLYDIACFHIVLTGSCVPNTTRSYHRIAIVHPAFYQPAYRTITHAIASAWVCVYLGGPRNVYRTSPIIKKRYYPGFQWQYVRTCTYLQFAVYSSTEKRNSDSHLLVP